MTQATELRELASLIHVDGSNSYVGVSSTAFTPTDAFVVKADGARITVESADMEVAMLGRRGSSGTALDSGYLRLRNQGVTADGVVLDSDANSWINGGNLGIGTNLPGEKLHVLGATRFETGSTSGGFKNYFANTGTGGEDYWIMSTSDANGSLSGGKFVIGSDAVSGNNAAQTRFLINSSGNVGIGEISPDYQLHVSGAGDIKIEDTSGGSAHLRIGASTSNLRNSEWKIKVSGSLDEFHIDHDYTANDGSNDVPVSGFSNAFKINSIQSLYNDNRQPTVRPTLNLDFANSKQLDPRITFYRDSIATYYDSNGILRYANVNEPRFDHDPVTGESKGLLIEEARTNIVVADTNFGLPINFNAMYNITNTRLAPDGTMSATDVLANSGVSRHEVNIIYPGTTGTVYTASLYVKPLGAVQWLVLSRAGGTDQLGFDLINITTNTPGGTASGTISEVGNGWIKLTFSFTEATTGSARSVYMSPGINTPTSSVYNNLNGDGLNGIALWGAHLEAGSFATSYIPSDTRFTSRSSTATYHDETGILRTAPANSPRYGYKYDGRKWVETGLILENAATNRYTTATGHDTISSVTGAGTVITNNYSTAPDGSNTALRFQYTSAGYGYRYWPNVHGNGNIHTHSFYIKPVSGNTHARHMIGGTPGSGSWLLNFDNQTTTQNSGNATTYGYTYEKLADGWWRVSISFSLPNSTGYVEVQWSGNANPTDYYVWGMQVEDGLIASSFISVPSFASATRSADVFSSDAYTRAMDVAKINSINYSDWYNTKQGSIYVDFDPSDGAGSDAVVVGIGDGTSRGFRAPWLTGANQIRLGTWSGTAYSALHYYNSVTTTNQHKAGISFSYEDQTFLSSLDGSTTAVTSSWAGVETDATTIWIGGETDTNRPYSGTIGKVAIYNEDLTTAELQALTENN